MLNAIIAKLLQLFLFFKTQHLIDELDKFAEKSWYK